MTFYDKVRNDQQWDKVQVNFYDEVGHFQSGDKDQVTFHNNVRNDQSAIRGSRYHGKSYIWATIGHKVKFRWPFTIKLEMINQGLKVR